MTAVSTTQSIIDHYATYDEAERLKHDIGPLELVRTRELMLRYLPPAPATVLDIGGATGIYSFWLAGLGYDVHLVDIVPRHIEQAREAAQEPGSPQLASMRVGDARSLDFDDNFADAIVMHGPLYHLPERDGPHVRHRGGRTCFASGRPPAGFRHHALRRADLWHNQRPRLRSRLPRDDPQ